jgi:hypothetical protein
MAKDGESELALKLDPNAPFGSRTIEIAWCREIPLTDIL